MTRAAAPPDSRRAIRSKIRQAYREAILAAAERVFTRSGFRATRMADIAGEAEVAVGTLYNYFESKELILQEMIATRHGELIASLGSCMEIPDPIDRLQTMLRTCFEFLEKESVVCAIFMELGAVSEIDIERIAGARGAESYAEVLALLERTLRAAAAAGRLRKDVKVRDLVAVLSGAMNGTVYAWVKRGRRGRLTDAAESVLRVFLQGAEAR